MSGFDASGFHSPIFDVLQAKIDEMLRSDIDVAIIARGRRFKQRNMETDRAVYHLSCEDIRDPAEQGEYRQHVGWHRAILETLTQVPKFVEHLDSILRFVRENNGQKILVDLCCKSGRHRSVGEGFVLFHCLRSMGVPAALLHASSWKWVEMRCGSKRRECRDLGASVKAAEHLFPKSRPAVVIRARGSVASRNKPDVRDEAHAPKAPPPEPASKDQEIQELREIVDDLAKNVEDLQSLKAESGRGRSSGRARSRSPLRRRYKLPTPPRARRRRSPSMRRKSPPGRRVTRGRSPEIRSRRPPLRPQPPDHPPPHREPVPDQDTALETEGTMRSRAVPSDRLELERLVKENLAFGGVFDNRNISVATLDGELLSEIVNFCIQEGNRDRLFWITDEGGEHKDGVRMNVLIRDFIRGPRIAKGPGGIGHADWRRSTRRPIRGRMS